MNILSRFIIVNGMRINISNIYPYHSDGISRPTLRIYIPFDNATFDQCYEIMNNSTEIEEWAIVEENEVEVEKHITTHTNYTNSSSLEYNTDQQYPNNWMIDIMRKSAAELQADFNMELIQANELALLDVYEAVLSNSLPPEEEKEQQ